jgi:hypothetical protein
VFICVCERKRNAKSVSLPPAVYCEEVDASNIFYLMLTLTLNWAMLLHLHFFLCRPAKKTSPDNRLECICKCKKASSRGFYHIYLVFSG